MKMVYVEWFDSFGVSPGWELIHELNPEPHIAESVGWLAHDANDCIVVIPHISPGDPRTGNKQGCGDMTIPKCAIKRMVELKAPKHGK